MAGNPPSARPMSYPGVPLWHDGMQAYGYMAGAGAMVGGGAPSEVAKKPRPRKPYTATKTREMWTTEEHSRMLEGLKLYKRDWAKVTAYVGTRSPAQVRSHAQKYFDRVQRDKTNDYVPQARPKRKSSAPYPRKVLTETPHYTPQAMPYPMPPHMPLTIAMDPYLVAPPQSPFMAPPPHLAYSLHPGMYASGAIHPHHHMHAMPHASPIVLGAPPPMTSLRPPDAPPMASMPMSSSDGVQQGAVFSPLPRGPMQVAGMFSTWSMQGSPPQMPRAYAHSVASPLSVDGRGYAIHTQSVVRMEEGMLAGRRPAMYGAISPVTPAARTAEAVKKTDESKPQTSHVPVHSHPNGPDPNCVKCNALKKFGNVLSELGAIRETNIEKKPQEEKIMQKEVSSKENETQSGKPEQESKPQVEVIRERYDASRPYHEVRENGIRLLGKVNDGGAMEQAETSGDDVKLDEGGTKGRGPKGSSVNPIASVLTTDRDPKEALQSGGGLKRGLGDDTILSGGAAAAKRLRSDTQIDESARTQNQKSPQTTDANAAAPMETYSKNEQREIFDAVHSLQILGRSSTPEK